LGVATVGENHAVAGHNRRIEARITCDVDLDDPIDAMAVRQSLYAFGDVLYPVIDDLVSPAARAWSAFAGVLTVAMTFAAPMSLAIWTA
jgi:hypothetical protein